MPLTVLQTRGIPGGACDRIVAAVEAAGKRTRGRFEAWMTADGRGSVRVVITGPKDFDRHLAFAVDEAEAEITEQVRRAVEE